MLDVIKMPKCESGQSILSEMFIPQPAMYLAGLLLLISLILITNKNQNTRYFGQSLMFIGFAIGAIPTINNLLLMFSDCNNKEIMEKLYNILPISNMVALLIVFLCFAGIITSLFSIKNKPKKDITDKPIKI